MIIKDIHLACAALTITLFIIRGVWMLRESSLAGQRWPRFVAPVIDTTLLLTGIAMMLRIEQYPGDDAWLTAKLSAVLVYVGFGIVGLNRGRTKGVRASCWVMALLVFGYVVSVASTRQPMPWL
ncbi:MAG: SirB2 family protein [Mariprofundaceae bacterium]